MQAYDRSYNPPAPVADVVIAHPVTGLASNPLRGKIDTGADLTVIPRSVVAALALLAHGQIWTCTYDRAYSQRAVDYVRLVIAEHELRTVRCIAAERETVLVGRNVLNRFVLTLDGVNLRFELELRKD